MEKEVNYLFVPVDCHVDSRRQRESEGAKVGRESFFMRRITTRSVAASGVLLICTFLLLQYGLGTLYVASGLFFKVPDLKITGLQSWGREFSWLYARWHLHYSGVLRKASSNLPELLISFVFVDPRFKSRIRIIALGNTRRQSVFCHYYLSDKYHGSAEVIHFEPIMKDQDLLYDGILIDCPFPLAARAKHQISVSVSASRSTPGDTRFFVHHPPASPPKTPSIASCVSPLYGFVNPLHFVSWVELNRLLGVKHFTFYDYRISGLLVPILRLYERRGIAEVVHWKTRPVPTMEVGTWPPSANHLHYFGQFPAFNDCLYRTGNRFRFIMFTDLDEILLPLLHGNLSQLLHVEDRDYISQFKFRNSYMRSDLPETKTEGPGLTPSPVFMRRVYRERRVLQPQVGAKVVVKFDNSLVMGIHDLIASSSHDKISHVINEKLGLLLHYRDPPRNLAEGGPGEKVEQLAALIPPLRNAVKARFREIKRLVSA